MRFMRVPSSAVELPQWLQFIVAIFCLFCSAVPTHSQTDSLSFPQTATTVELEGLEQAASTGVVITGWLCPAASVVEAYRLDAEGARVLEVRLSRLRDQFADYIRDSTTPPTRKIAKSLIEEHLKTSGRIRFGQDERTTGSGLLRPYLLAHTPSENDYPEYVNRILAEDYGAELFQDDETTYHLSAHIVSESHRGDQSILQLRVDDCYHPEQVKAALKGAQQALKVASRAARELADQVRQLPE